MSGSPAISPAMTIGRHRLALSNLSKRLYPSGFTKADVIYYYLRVGPAMLPYLRGRAVTLRRYPAGSDAEGFFQKNCPEHRPAWVGTARPRAAKRTRGSDDGGAADDGPAYCLIDSPAALVWAANLAALELHVTMAKAANPDRPTAMVFDLDPGPPAGIADCLRLGLKLRDLLANVGLRTFPKTSGSKGLHVYVPLKTPGVTFDDTRAFARAVAQVLERQEPKGVTATMAKAGRAGKVFVDWSQNDPNKTTACAYSLRARPEPTVSTPVEWGEVERAAKSRAVAALSFDAPAVLARLARQGDVFSPVLTLRQKLPSLGVPVS